MIADVLPSCVKLTGIAHGRVMGGGSGFIISRDGHVVTNSHVFDGLAAAGATELRAEFDDGHVYAVEFVASDAESDIAVGRIIAPPGTVFPPPLRIGKSSTMRPGDRIAVMGAPLGGGIVPTVGVLGGQRFVADDERMSAVLNSRADWRLLQVDAAMSSGSSGGPVVNSSGEVVGVSCMVQTAAGAGTVGAVNYGVAVDTAWPVVQALLSQGAVPRPLIGLSIVAVDALAAARDAAAERNGRGPLLPPGGRWFAGLFVADVVPSRPAALAGLRAGDVLLEMDGRPLVRKGDYFAALGPVYEPGRRLVVTAWRPSERRQFEATIVPELRTLAKQRSWRKRA